MYIEITAEAIVETQVEIDGLRDMIEKGFENLTDTEVLDLMDVISNLYDHLDTNDAEYIDEPDTDFYEVTGHNADDLIEELEERYIKLATERDVIRRMEYRKVQRTI